MKTGLKTAIAAGGLSVALAAGVFIGEALAAQPHMAAALQYLRSARGELEVASHNKGGHRVEAIRLTDEAIRETEAGMEDADR